MVAARSLTSTCIASITYSLPLAKDQWILEVMNWADIMMVNTRRMVVEFATGPSNPQFVHRFSTPNDPVQKQMCSNQRVPSLPHYTSINVLGMAIIFSFGILFMLVNHYLDTIVWGIERRFQNDQRHYKHTRWILDGTLQLQRLYCQSLGLGRWEYCDEEMPMTPPGDKFCLPADFGDEKTKTKEDAVENVIDSNRRQQVDETKNLISAEATSLSPTDSNMSPRTPETVNTISPTEIHANLGDRTISHQDSELNLLRISTDPVNSTIPQQLRRWPMGRRDRYAMLADDDAIPLVDT